MNRVLLGQVAKGEFVRRNQLTKKTYIRGEYDKTTKKYELINCEDINQSIQLMAKTFVYIGFTY